MSAAAAVVRLRDAGGAVVLLETSRALPLVSISIGLKTGALLDVPGIGPVTARKLLRAFGSLDGVRRAGRAELVAVAGEKIADSLAGTPSKTAP